jgi:pimeloyl-ACP methyl ester carboxylesterase
MWKGTSRTPLLAPATAAAAPPTTHAASMSARVPAAGADAPPPACAGEPPPPAAAPRAAAQRTEDLEHQGATTAPLCGELFVYCPHKRLVAFHHAAMGHTAACARNVVVFIGGLSDGFCATPYLAPLAAALPPAGWSLLQVLLSSSYAGWGTASLAGDAAELRALLAHLTRHRGVERVLLFGHSTGAQDCIQLLRHGHDADDQCATACVAGVVLQGAVSDREFLATLRATPARLAAAQALLAAGRGAELLPRCGDDEDEEDDTPVCAARFVALAAVGGADDFFSSDLSDAQLRAALGHVTVPVLLAPSGADEYVPAGVDGGALARRLAGAMHASPRVEVCVVDGAPHAPEEPCHVAQLLQAVLDMLRRLG